MNEGWYYDANSSRLYVRSLDDPARHDWQMPLLSHAFDINARDWLWIEGFEMRFYGARYSGCGVCAQNASHLVVRKNKIHNLQLGIFTNWTGGEDRGNDTRIESNEIYDPLVNEFPWQATKGLPQRLYARNLRSAFIWAVVIPLIVIAIAVIARMPLVLLSLPLPYGLQFIRLGRKLAAYQRYVPEIVKGDVGPGLRFEDPG